MYKLNFLSCVLASSIAATASAADVSFSGYGSLVAGKVLSGDKDSNGTREYMADFYDVGIYNEDISYKAESMFAVQTKIAIDDKLSAIAQLVAKGPDNFKPDLDWYYLKYQINDKWSVMAGRRNIPMYYFSEYMEVGFAYPWIRPAWNLYWWQITQFNGATVSYDFELADGALSNTISVFSGDEYTVNNKEMTYYNSIGFYANPNGGPGKAVSTDENWLGIKGFNWHMSHEIFDLRFSYFKHTLDRYVHYNNVIGQPRYDAAFPTIGISNYNTEQTFIGLGGSVNISAFTLIFDINSVTRNDKAETKYPTYLATVVYNWDKYQPFIGISKADQKEVTTQDLEEHQLIVAGVRYNFMKQAALKLQIDHFIDQGEKTTGWNYHGDANMLSIAVDYVF